MNPTDNKERVLVTGATGVVGPVLVQRLIDAGFAVRALCRSSPPVKLLPSSVEIYRGDVADASLVADAVSGCSAVFHLAAKLHINKPQDALQAEYDSINVHGTELVAEAAERNNARLLFFSSICVYGPTNTDDLADEDSPLNPQSMYAESKILAEHAAKRIIGSNLTILRIASVYGPRMKGNYLRLASAMRRGWFVPVGRGQNRRTLIFDMDVVTAAIEALKNSVSRGKTYNVTDGYTHRFSEIVAAIAEAEGLSPPRLFVPEILVRIGVHGLSAFASRLGISTPVSPEMLDKLLEDVAISGANMRRELNLPLAVSLKTGWHRSLAQQR